MDKIYSLASYLVAVHHVTTERLESDFMKHLAELERLHKED